MRKVSNYKSNLTAKTIKNATPEEQVVLDKALAQVGFIPNMYSNMVNLPGLLDTYLEGYAAFREQSELTAAEQEVVFLTISRDNECHYCVAAHSMLADNMSGVPLEVTDAIRNGTQISDAKLAALHKFTHHMLITQGRPNNEAVEAFLSEGYIEKNILAIILAISVKTISNYSNHVFDTEVDDMFESRFWSAS